MLINREGTHPAGGFPFIDPRTGKSFDGMSADFRGQVTNIVQHRQANPKLYPPNEMQYLAYEAVANELDKYQCDRLGNDPRFCNGNTPRNYVAVSPDKSCPKCKSKELDPRYCSVCSGRKLIGYHCKSCGFDSDL